MGKQYIFIVDRMNQNKKTGRGKPEFQGYGTLHYSRIGPCKANKDKGLRGWKEEIVTNVPRV